MINMAKVLKETFRKTEQEINKIKSYFDFDECINYVEMITGCKINTYKMKFRDIDDADVKFIMGYSTCDELIITDYIKSIEDKDLRNSLLVHELIHAVQINVDPVGFRNAVMANKKWGKDYVNDPIEKQAYDIQKEYLSGLGRYDLVDIVNETLEEIKMGA